jgi:hypothetical protein
MRSYTLSVSGWDFFHLALAVRNKLCQIVVLIARVLMLSDWPTFFPEIVAALVSPFFGNANNISALLAQPGFIESIQMFLRLCEELDLAVVHVGNIISGEDQFHNNAIVSGANLIILCFMLRWHQFISDDHPFFFTNSLHFRSLINGRSEGSHESEQCASPDRSLVLDPHQLVRSSERAICP